MAEVLRCPYLRPSASSVDPLSDKLGRVPRIGELDELSRIVFTALYARGAADWADEAD